MTTDPSGPGGPAEPTDPTAPDAPLSSGPLGMRLLDFLRFPEDSPPTDHPVSYVLIVLCSGDRRLMVHVRQRDCWELPGGGIEPGETPRQAAVRELREESGQLVPPDALRFAGYARTLLRGRGVRHGAVYTARASEQREFTPDDEITAVHWWNGVDPFTTGTLQTVDADLAVLALQDPGR